MLALVESVKKRAKKLNAGKLAHCDCLARLARANGFTSWDRMAYSLADGNAKFSRLDDVNFSAVTMEKPSTPGEI